MAAGSVAALQFSGPGIARLAASETAGTLPHDGVITGVVATDSGAIAIGHDQSGAVKVWRRADADEEWSRGPADGDFDSATVLGLAAAGGAYVAVGYREYERQVGTATGEEGQSLPITEREFTPAAWTSTDGSTWRVAETPGTAAVLLDVSASRDGFLAVGAVLDGETAEGVAPFVASSSDGSAWAAVDTSGLPDDTPEGGLQSVATRGGGWFALSLDMEGAVVWTSSDGVSWSEHTSFPAGDAPAALADGPGGLVAVGATVPDAQPRYWRVTGNGPTQERLPSSVSDSAILRDLVGTERGHALLVGEQQGRPLAADAEA